MSRRFRLATVLTVLSCAGNAQAFPTMIEASSVWDPAAGLLTLHTATVRGADHPGDLLSYSPPYWVSWYIYESCTGPDWPTPDSITGPFLTVSPTDCTITLLDPDPKWGMFPPPHVRFDWNAVVTQDQIGDRQFPLWVVHSVDDIFIGGGSMTRLTNTAPAPGAILLGTIGAGLVGWLRRRRAL